MCRNFLAMQTNCWLSGEVEGCGGPVLVWVLVIWVERLLGWCLIPCVIHKSHWRRVMLVEWTFNSQTTKALVDNPAISMLMAPKTRRCGRQLHSSEWTFIVASARHTCIQIVMLFNQHLDRPHLPVMWMDYLAKGEVLTNTYLTDFCLKPFVCVEKSLRSSNLEQI